MITNTQHPQWYLIYPCWWCDSAGAVLFRLVSSLWCVCVWMCMLCCVRLLQTSPPGCVTKALTLIRSPFSVHYAGPLGRPQQIRTISTPLTSSLKLKWHSLHPTCHTHTHTHTHTHSCVLTRDDTQTQTHGHVWRCVYHTLLNMCKPWHISHT